MGHTCMFEAGVVYWLMHVAESLKSYFEKSI